MDENVCFLQQMIMEVRKPAFQISFWINITGNKKHYNHAVGDAISANPKPFGQ